MPVIHAYASLPHYWAHMAPIWRALPEEVRGSAWGPRAEQPWGGRVPRDIPRDDVVMVAGAVDGQRAPASRLVYVEHGAGQSYGGDPRGAASPSFSGGPGHERVVLFIAPGEHVAERWRARYRAPVAVVGCPRLDRWHCDIRTKSSAADVTPTVAATFHWDCALVPETTSALPHYREPAWRAVIGALEAAGGSFVGHWHPRAARGLQALWGRLGAASTDSLDLVFARADLLVADNTSALYEFASLGRPVLVLNAPWYRRGVEHGLRFWSHLPGLACDHPRDLPEMVERALADPPEAQALRQRAVAHVYAHTDGRAAERAAQAIVEVVS